MNIDKKNKTKRFSLKVSNFYSTYGDLSNTCKNFKDYQKKDLNYTKKMQTLKYHDMIN